MSHKTFLSKAALAFAASAITFPAWQARAASSTTLAAYTWEWAPLIGLDLPSQLWPPGMLYVAGIRAARTLPVGALTLGLMYQHNGDHNQNAYNADFGYRYELDSRYVFAFLDAGLHESYYMLHSKYDSNGACLPSNCETDTGNHWGVYFGGGFQIPITPMMPVKFDMRLYAAPQTWLLVDVSVGFRY